jgi:hypothetical protein
MVAVLQGMGYPARVVLMDGHIVSEVFLPARGQWVVADALYDAIPWAPGSGPLSLVQLKRRLERGEPVEWRSVVGEKADDDEMDPATRKQVEGIVVRDALFTCDGLSIFGPLEKPQRVVDLAAGRARAIQLALFGEPALDARERGLRRALVLWNLAALAGTAALAWNRRRAPEAPASGASPA